MTTERADLVIVGAGTIGGWSSVFAREGGAGRVVVLERGLAGDGASSRAAGIVRAQGGIPQTVALGRWSIAFYNGQAARYGTDSGFRELGYVILAATAEDEAAGRERVAMQRAEGLDVRWVDAAEASDLTGGTLAAEQVRGASYVATDGAISPPRNVRAYSLAMQQAGVELRERTAFKGLVARRRAGRGGRDVGRHDRDRAGPADRRADAPCRRPRRRCPDPGRRRSPHRGRHGAPSRVRRPAPADGLRAPARPVLAAGGRRSALRLERSGRAAGRSPLDRHGRPRRSSASAWPSSSRSRASSDCARSGRRRSTTRPITCRSSARAWTRTARRSPG